MRSSIPKRTLVVTLLVVVGLEPVPAGASPGSARQSLSSQASPPPRSSLALTTPPGASGPRAIPDAGRQKFNEVIVFRVRSLERRSRKPNNLQQTTLGPTRKSVTANSPRVAIFDATNSLGL